MSNFFVFNLSIKEDLHFCLRSDIRYVKVIIFTIVCSKNELFNYLDSYTKFYMSFFKKKKFNEFKASNLIKLNFFYSNYLYENNN